MTDMSTLIEPWPWPSLCFHSRSVIVSNPQPGATACSGLPTLSNGYPQPSTSATALSMGERAHRVVPASPVPAPPSRPRVPARRAPGTRSVSVSALVSRLNCSSSGSDVPSRTSSDTEGCSTEDRRQEKIFPWLAGFTKQCRAVIGCKSVKQLDSLLTTYIEHVTSHYRDCHKLPNKAAKLKRNINDTMLFFHMVYMDIREPLESGFYYDKMTELMAMYLDLEITASRRGKDTEKTVTNKLSTSLYTFLDYSEDHILDALLKSKLINKHSKKVCVPLLRKILSELVVRRPLSELTYVRFLLSFKLWKNVVADVEERRAINKLAVQRLHPPPDYFQEHDLAKAGAEVLPSVPKTKKNCTSFYIQSKINLKDACKAFFRYYKDNCRSHGHRRHLAGTEEIAGISSWASSKKCSDMEEEGSCSLINDIWSAISNGEPSSSLLGESDMFSDILSEDNSLSESAVNRKKKQLESPGSGSEVSLNDADEARHKDLKKKKAITVPDPKFVIVKSESVVDHVSTVSPAKGVQDCCLGSVFVMEQVNEVGAGQSKIKTDPCERELPTSSRQHSVLESLVYAPPGSDNEAVASSSVSPDTGSVPPSRLDTNECDSSVEILQSQQGSADVRCTLPIGLKSELNIDEDLQGPKVEKEDLNLLLSESDTVSGGENCFDSTFGDFMIRLNDVHDDLFPCRNSFGELDQASMIYRRSDVSGSLPFQGNPLLEEDEDEFGRSFRWSSVPDYHPSVQSTIINQSSGSAADLVSCYAELESTGKDKQEEKEEPKLGPGQVLESKQGKVPAAGSRRRSRQSAIDSTCGGVLGYLGLGSTAPGQSDLVDFGLDDLGLERDSCGDLDEDLGADFDTSSEEENNVEVEIVQPSSTPPKRPDVRRGRPPKRRGSNVSQTAVASTTSTASNAAVAPKKPRQKATSICALPLTRSIADAVGIRLPDPIKEMMVTSLRKQQPKKNAL